MFINTVDPWWELKLDNHRMWNRLHVVSGSGVGAFCSYMNKAFNEEGQRVFSFPHHLDKSGFKTS